MPSVDSLQSLDSNDRLKLELFDQYCIAYDIPVERKPLLFLISLDEPELKLLSALCHPVDPATLTYDELKRLHQRCQSDAIVDVHSQRFQFYASRQIDITAEATAMNWLDHLRRKSLQCKFGIRLEAILLDQFVVGLKDARIQAALIQMLDDHNNTNNSKPSLLEVVQMAIDLETQ